MELVEENALEDVFFKKDKESFKALFLKIQENTADLSEGPEVRVNIYEDYLKIAKKPYKYSEISSLRASLVFYTLSIYKKGILREDFKEKIFDYMLIHDPFHGIAFHNNWFTTYINTKKYYIRTDERRTKLKLVSSIRIIED